MANEEEDVIFEGQQIDNYLNEIGFKEYEVSKRDVSSSSERKDTCNNKVVGVYRSSTWYWPSESWWLNMWVDSTMYHVQVETILQSGLLFEEDIHLLGNIIPDVEEYAADSWRISPLIQGALLFSIGSLSWWCYSIWGTAILPLTASSSVVLYSVWDWRKALVKRRRLQQLKTFLNVLQDLFLILRKATKLIQENELVLRGFTLAKSGSAVSRLENSELPCMARRWQSLPGLRKGIAYATLEAIYILKSGTQNLIASCPLCGQLDNTSHYLSFLDQEALGLPSFDEIDIEDELKLGTLKRLHHIFLLLQSEFLRRLALCFCPNLWKRKLGKQIDMIMQIINQVTVHCMELKSNLDREYKVFYSYGLSEGVQSKETIPANEQKPWMYADAYIAIHSAGLHLQAMLFRVRTVEQLLETQTKDEVTGCCDDIRMKMVDTLQELDVCKTCCEESLAQLNKLDNSITSADVPSLEDAIENVSDSTDVQSKPIPVGYTDLDPKVEDEVYEAIISQESADTEYDDSDFMKLSKEELIKHAKEKQLSKRMLQELKSVLVDKAQEWKEREAKAIENKQGRHEMLVMKDGKVLEKNDYTRSCVSEEKKVQLHDNLYRAAAAAADVFSPESPKSQITSSSNLGDMSNGSSMSTRELISKIDLSEMVTSSCEGDPPQDDSCLLGNIDCDSSQVSDDSISSIGSGSFDINTKHEIEKGNVSVIKENWRLSQSEAQINFGNLLTNDAVAKVRSSNLASTADTFYGMGDKSSSEESLKG